MDLNNSLKPSYIPCYVLTKILALCPYKYDKENDNYCIDKKSIIYNLVYYIITVIVAQLPDAKDFSDDDVTMSASRVYYFCFRQIPSVTILMNIIKVKSLVKLFNDIRNIDKQLVRLRGKIDSKLIRNITNFTMVVFSVFLVCSFSVSIMRENLDRVLSVIIYFNALPMNVGKLQYYFLLHVIKHRMDVSLNLFVRFTYKSHMEKDKWVLETVENIYTTYNDICNICLETNKMFSVQMLLFYVHAVLSAVIEIYFCYIMKHLSIVMIISFWQWIIWRLLYLWIVAYLHHSIQRQVQMMTSTIHKFLNKAKDPELKLMLKIFVKKELNRNFSFTICGLFPADLTMIQTVVATVTTYVLLLVQLKAARNT